MTLLHVLLISDMNIKYIGFMSFSCFNDSENALNDHSGEPFWPRAYISGFNAMVVKMR